MTSMPWWMLLYTLGAEVSEDRDFKVTIRFSYVGQDQVLGQWTLAAEAIEKTLEKV